MERNIVDKPLVLPISTPLGYYIYETNRNEVISVSKEMFSYIQAIMGNNASEISRTSDNVKTQYAELAGCGYFSPPRVEKVEHPATYHLKHYLARNIEKVTLQITQNCNLRCKYCIYSEDSNLSQRSHSSNKMTFDIAKKALDFYWEHSRDSKSVMVGLYGGEPLLEYPLIVEIVKYAESIFAGKALSFMRITDGSAAGYTIEKSFAAAQIIIVCSIMPISGTISFPRLHTDEPMLIETISKSIFEHNFNAEIIFYSLDFLLSLKLICE